MNKSIKQPYLVHSSNHFCTKNKNLNQTMESSNLDVPPSAKKLAGKVALITGGASGIGERTSRLFIQHGAKVAVADIQDDLGNSLRAELGASSIYIHCDVTNEEDVIAAVDLTVRTFGQLDVMFNNAGITGPPIPSTVDYPLSDFRRVIDVNLIGPFLGTKHAARVMIPRRTGCIVSTSSMASLSAGAASHAYTCSKHAVVGLTRNAAMELGRYGIRVNCVSPAGLATPLATGYVGMSGEEFEGLMGEVAVLKGVVLNTVDVARAVLFLASEDSRFVSGQNLAIDGAYTVGGSMNVFQEG